MFLLSCPFFMMLQPLSILRKCDGVSLKKAVRTFSPSNFIFSGNIEPIIFCFSLNSQSVSLSGILVIKLIPFFPVMVARILRF